MRSEMRDCETTLPAADAAFQSHYQKHGFAVARSIVPARYTNQLLQQLPNVISERRDLGLPSGLNVWLDSPPALAIVALPSILSHVTNLLGRGSVRLWHDQAFLREPGTPGTPPHQDSPHWQHPFVNAVTAWLPLNDPSIAGGAMVYLRGSHKAGAIEPCGDLRMGEGWPLLQSSALRDFEPVTVACQVGDVLFHHPLTVHYTTDAMASVARAGYSAIYVAEDELRLNAEIHSAEFISKIFPRVIAR